MVKSRRGQIGLLTVLGAAAVLSLYYGFRSGPDAPARAGKAGPTSFELEAVEPIDLARVEKLKDAVKTESESEDEGLDGSGPAAAPTPPVVSPPVAPLASAAPLGPDGAPLAGPSMPPMNLRYIGAVQVPDGAWVAALVTDRKELLTGKEGDVVANRFRIVKIGVESIDLLETASGHQRRVKIGGSS
jgi:hypothetical protein